MEKDKVVALHLRLKNLNTLRLSEKGILNNTITRDLCHGPRKRGVQSQQNSKSEKKFEIEDVYLQAGRNSILKDQSRKKELKTLILASRSRQSEDPTSVGPEDAGQSFYYDQRMEINTFEDFVRVYERLYPREYFHKVIGQQKQEDLLSTYEKFQQVQSATAEAVQKVRPMSASALRMSRDMSLSGISRLQQGLETSRSVRPNSGMSASTSVLVDRKMTVREAERQLRYFSCKPGKMKVAPGETNVEGFYTKVFRSGEALDKELDIKLGHLMTKVRRVPRPSYQTERESPAIVKRLRVKEENLIDNSQLLSSPLVTQRKSEQPFESIKAEIVASIDKVESLLRSSRREMHRLENLHAKSRPNSGRTGGAPLRQEIQKKHEFSTRLSLYRGSSTALRKAREKSKGLPGAEFSSNQRFIDYFL
eukprot:TRINITY_DN12152_c0_g1_i1.p1 TRINITY_DN12152_c0_g1~~TRINITY_DN12152_c0_g1_i1.p1  ORF type:complete len:421 (-),score=68.17 TRINITY_DN12152_c0_g1_i1:340-1602(-)